MRYVIALLAACGSTPGSATTQPGGQTIPVATENAELDGALAKLSWWLGDWRSTDGKSEEHWTAAAGALYGIGLHDGGFEAMIVDDADNGGPADGILRFIAMPGGTRSVEFRADTVDDTSALFANPAHDDPKTIGYARTGDTLRATLHGEQTITFDFARADLPRAPELEKADLAFSDETQKRGADGWMAAFDPSGAMMRRGERITGPAIGEMMKPLFAEGSLVWAPIDSGARGDIGFTVGKAQFTGKRPEDSWRSTYVTIWKRQPDKSWKVLFDTGRPVNE